jgi:uncharacterized protein YodC (DUF2158 family)
MIAVLKFSPGDRVVIGEGEDKFTAIVNKVIIERGAILYEAEWFVNRVANYSSFYENELVPESTPNGLALVKKTNSRFDEKGDTL